ncbi:hypothetical protein [Roseovarius sp. D0-M9]
MMNFDKEGQFACGWRALSYIFGFFAVCVGVRVSGQFTTTPDVVS